MAGKVITGGDKLAAKLREIGSRAAGKALLKVGFLETAGTEANGMPIAAVAYINEYGATINMPARTQTINTKKTKKGNRFVKASAKGAVSSTVDVPAHTVVIPPRPFFRGMIAKNEAGWPETVAKLLKKHDYDAAEAMNGLGLIMAGQLEESITDFTSPGNAKSTIRKKGFDKPLTDTGDMKRAVDYEVGSE